MVTWGQNTTHTIAGTPGATPAPAAGGAFSFGPAPAPFGSPAPATATGGGLFGGSSTTTSFGSPAPAAGTGLFGTPAPAPGTSLFGTPAPASGTGLFGAPAPATGTGLFGAPAPPTGTGLFGAPAPGGLFGAPAAPVAAPQGPQIPAQAAYQAHQNAQAQQVVAEFQDCLQRLYHAYRGSAAAPSPNESAPFTTVLFNPASTEYQQHVWLVQGRTGNLAAKPIPDRPLHISVKDWELASLHAPEGYQPTAAVGAVALQARLSAQQELADNTLQQIKALRQFQKSLEERKQAANRQGLSIMKDRLQKERKQRLWQIIQKVEMIRSYQQPLTKDERLAMEQTVQLNRATESLASKHIPTAVHTGMPRLLTPNGQEPADPEQVRRALEEHRKELFQLMTAVKKDLRDVKLITDRLKK